MAYDLLWQETWSKTALLELLKKIHLQILENIKECYGYICLDAEIWKPAPESMNLLLHRVWHTFLREICVNISIS